MIDFFKYQEMKNREFRSRNGFNPFEKTGICGGRHPSKKKKSYNVFSEDDPINFDYEI